MSNWNTEYRVKYHITIVHDDGRTEVVKDNMIVESRSPEEAEKIILDKYKHGDEPLSDFSGGLFGHIRSEDLKIDEIEQVWEY